MKNADHSMTFTYKGEEFKVHNAHIYHTEAKSVLEDGLILKNILKVRIPLGGVKTPPVGARTVFKNKTYVVLLARENFKGKNPHIYLELQS